MEESANEFSSVSYTKFKFDEAEINLTGLLSIFILFLFKLIINWKYKSNGYAVQISLLASCIITIWHMPMCKQF